MKQIVLNFKRETANLKTVAENERLDRIFKSMRKINRLMAELKEKTDEA